MCHGTPPPTGASALFTITCSDHQSSGLSSSGQGSMQGLTFEFSGHRDFYLALRDIGTCVDIGRVILYYRVAPGCSDTFLSCPDVPLPVVGSQIMSMLSCTCINTTSGWLLYGRVSNFSG